MNCYGDVGPWRQRPGWEQLAQSVSGIAAVQGGDGPPTLIPAAACDYTTGYLATLGTIAALWRRSHEGGSYHVRASLCQTAGWFAGEPRSTAKRHPDSATSSRSSSRPRPPWRRAATPGAGHADERRRSHAGRCRRRRSVRMPLRGFPRTRRRLRARRGDGRTHGRGGDRSVAHRCKPLLASCSTVTPG